MARLQQTQRKRVGSVPRLPVDVVAAIAAEDLREDVGVSTRVFQGLGLIRRFRECVEEECGYHKWVDPPLGPRAVAMIEELQESIAEQVHRSGRRMDKLIEKHQTQMNNVKKKQEFTIIAMFVLFFLMMNIVLGAVGHEAMVEDGGYSSESD
ncbi:hypothetical protein AgCh_000653 [Apium graveolens]